MIEHIDTGVLHSEKFAAYISRCDRRVRDGVRAALEALEIPLPEAFTRRPTGIKPGKAIAAAYAADVAIHGDRAYDKDGNRRLIQDGKLPPPVYSRPAAEVAASKAGRGTARPDPEQPTHTLFDEVFCNLPTD